MAVTTWVRNNVRSPRFKLHSDKEFLKGFDKLFPLKFNKNEKNKNKSWVIQFLMKGMRIYGSLMPIVIKKSVSTG